MVTSRDVSTKPFYAIDPTTGKGYFLVQDGIDLDWDVANGICRAYGGNLASIHSQGDIDFIKSKPNLLRHIGSKKHYHSLLPNRSNSYKWCPR